MNALKILLLFSLAVPAVAQDDFVPLPAGVRPVWDTSKAFHESTATREKICINGLWRWQPASVLEESVPTKNWGYFKVPGCWPGITDYMQKDFQTLYAHPSWKNERLGSASAAWYERTVSVPKQWEGRRIALSIDYLNSYAAVFVDGKKWGEVRFPGGELDLTAALPAGSSHTLAILVIAMPLKGVLLSYSDSNSAREVKGKVERRGLCGDVFLVSTPAGPHISSVKVETSVRKSELSFTVGLHGLAPDVPFGFRGQITNGGKIVRQFTSRTFRASAGDSGRFTFSESWQPEELWDIQTPGNQFEVTLSLVGTGERVIDTFFPQRFGFREFTAEGRDFYLNGSRIFLCAVPLDNAQVGAALASYGSARESLERLKNIGINFVYTHNYGCEPGSHLALEEILRAADDVGMLVSVSQPHFSHYEWRSPEADQTNGYARHAEYYTSIAGNHPSVIAYAMSHNATGYEEDMNPDLIDGIHDPRDQWSSRNAKLALRAESIVKRLDPGRMVYHHASGNLGSMHAINFYPNFVPVQELSDWFEHWASKGVKPVFMCEYGAPFTWDWTMYRGWYKGQREFGSAQVPWEFCLAEWNSQFLGDRAFQISKAEAANLRWEAKQFRAGKVWHRWDYPNQVGSQVFDEQYPIFARYLNDNWRAFRTWGVSAISPWEYGHYWKPRQSVDRRRKDLKVDWENLQRPGFSADYIDQQYERFDLSFERTDWAPTAAGHSLLRNNAPLLAYIAGKAAAFTSKDHILYPGETLEKQLVIINNSRQSVGVSGDWSLGLPETIRGKKDFTLKTGEQERVPLRFALPEALAPGSYQLSATVRFNGGESQTDSFAIHIIPRPAPAKTSGRLALFDPENQTGQLLNRLHVTAEKVDAKSDLAGIDTLIVGKGALTTNGAAPDIRRVREGLKVIVFEQSAAVLEKRLGFRVAEYGLRQVFPRIPDHPALAGISADHWRDWRGEGTTSSPRLEYTLRPRYGPTVNWCDIPVTRLWRCGNRGNVASVLIEKPSRGDFLPILDGGYSLQYSPLLEHREGKGMVLFCQLDVTGRTENEPVADTFTHNILSYVSGWKPAPSRSAVYAGQPEARRHLESAGFTLASYDGTKAPSNTVMILGPGAGRDLARSTKPIADWLNGGGKLLVLGFDQSNAEALLPVQVGMRRAEHIATSFKPQALGSPFQGISPADLHNRDPREFSVVNSATTVLGDGMLATASEGNIVFCQFLPWDFDPGSQSNLKRTYRRASFLLTRLLTNLGLPSASPILERFNKPAVKEAEKRWLSGLYLDQPEEWDDPYRFFRW